MKRHLKWIVPLLVVLALVVGVLRALDKRRNEQAAAAPARETLALDLAPGDVVTAKRATLARTSRSLDIQRIGRAADCG